LIHSYELWEKDNDLRLAAIQCHGDKVMGCLMVTHMFELQPDRQPPATPAAV
jgi:hypothetical protein